VLVILLLGWTILLPAIVVAGLYIVSTVLGRRRSALRVYDELLDQDVLGEASERRAYVPPFPRLTPERFGVPPLPTAETLEGTDRATARLKSDSVESFGRRPVGARY
jgi:hypothetical protein